MSVPTISQAEKDPFKIAAALRQAVEKINDTTGLTDGDKGDITVSASGATWTIDNGAINAAKLATDAVETLKIKDANVTNAKLANMAESTIKGRAAAAGTGVPTDLSATQATAILNAVVGDSGAGGTKGLVPAPAAGDAAAGKFLKADGTFAVPPAGAVLQVLQDTYATNADLTDQIPSDDTSPVKASEGTEVLSQAITPADNSNKVLVEAHIFGSGSVNNTDIVMAVFRDTTCINAVQARAPTANFPVTLSCAFLDSPASASAVTYSVNVGPVGAVTVRLNGNTTTRLFGGASACTLTLTEVAA
jgi:hypothetical protein